MAPGKVEDAKGRPFVGPAGTLLRNELRRQGVDPNLAYYMNVVCCMPPGNKVKANHADACRGNLKDQLDTAEAEYVLVCGNVAMEALLPHATPYTRGRLIHVHDKKLWGIYHPSHILQSKDPGLYKRWQETLVMFGLAMQGVGFDNWLCIYCGEVLSDVHLLPHPVCRKCMGKWKVDRRWRYMPPPQMRLEL